MPPAAAFGALHHIGIAVPNRDETVGRICALLGGTAVDSGYDNDLAVLWTWIASGGNPIVEIVAPDGSRGPVARYLEQRGPGLHHVSFRPVSLDDALDHVRACSLHVIGENRSHAGYEEFFVSPEETGGALFHSFRELS